MRPGCGSDPPTELNLQKSISLYPTHIPSVRRSITSATAALLPDIHGATVSHAEGSSFSLGKLHRCGVWMRGHFRVRLSTVTNLWIVRWLWILIGRHMWSAIKPLSWGLCEFTLSSQVNIFFHYLDIYTLCTYHNNQIFFPIKLNDHVAYNLL